MPKTTLKQKIFLFLFSFLLLLVLLEIGMRIAGAVVFYLQESHNHLSSKDNNYRILCLGESTTALGGEDSYPSQLERMLNEQAKRNKFTVINKGVISTNTDVILDHLEGNLDLYKPQMVIVMMGVNDSYLFQPSKMPLWLWRINLYFKDFKVYKLTKLLYKHITHRIKEISTPTGLDEDNQGTDSYTQKEDFIKGLLSVEIQVYQQHVATARGYESQGRPGEAQSEYQFANQAAVSASAASIDLARRYLQQNLLREAQEYLTTGIILNPKSTYAYQMGGDLYLAQAKGDQAITAYRKAFSLDSSNYQALLGLARACHQQHDEQAFLIYAGYLKVNPSDYWGYIELAGWLKEKKVYEQAIEYLNYAIQVDAGLDRAYLDLGEILEEEGQYKKEEELYLKLLNDNLKKFRFLQALVQFYHKHGKEDLSKSYFKKVLQMEKTQYGFKTRSNYDVLVNKILQRNIKVIVMQYPIRSIDVLKNYIGNRDGVTFVENKQNFKRALESGRFNDYFSDRFAYDFGHCTRLGNQLIVKNLTPVVLQLTESSAK